MKQKMLICKQNIAIERKKASAEAASADEDVGK